MIFDKIENHHFYAELGERFAVAFSFIENTEINTLETGRYDIMDSEVFALVSEYETKPLQENKWEAHQVYADIQVVIKGKEKMGFVSVDKLTPIDDYQAEKDIQFLEGQGDFVTMEPGSFVIFLPQDGHMPGVAINQPTFGKKIVIKVKMSK